MTEFYYDSAREAIGKYGKYGYIATLVRSTSDATYTLKYLGYPRITEWRPSANIPDVYWTETIDGEKDV